MNILKINRSKDIKSIDHFSIINKIKYKILIIN